MHRNLGQYQKHEDYGKNEKDKKENDSWPLGKFSKCRERLILKSPVDVKVVCSAHCRYIGLPSAFEMSGAAKEKCLH